VRGGRRPTAFGIIAVAGGMALSASLLYARDQRYPAPPVTERMLYVTSGSVIGRVMLSFDSLAADVYWIRAIQHYGRDRKSSRQSSRFELLEPLLNLTTSLDPLFSTAYRFGAIFLAIAPPDGPGKPEAAIALLEKGLRASPDRWQYAHDIGFVHYWHTGDFAKAADWFERAARMPGAPIWIGPVVAMTRAQGGNRAAARQMLQELLQSDEAYIRQAAERSLLQLEALDGIEQLQAFVEAYFKQTGLYPNTWLDLVKAGLLPAIPVDSTRTPFEYDRVTHMVTLGRKSPLAPLPQGLQRR
jgi:tetratricopeptide (TPR) repeat protein